jgi:hypothetical protein
LRPGGVRASYGHGGTPITSVNKIARIVIGMMRVILRGTLPALALALAGCAGMWFAEREPWRRDAELACLQSGAVKEGPTVTIVKQSTGQASAAPTIRSRSLRLAGRRGAAPPMRWCRRRVATRRIARVQRGLSFPPLCRPRPTRQAPQFRQPVPIRPPLAAGEPLRRQR